MKAYYGAGNNYKEVKLPNTYLDHHFEDHLPGIRKNLKVVTPIENSLYLLELKDKFELSKFEKYNNPKIVDVFLFHNELNMLELRLTEHDQYVDCFIIVEARKTFTNQNKSLNFELHRSRYSKWLHKIHYLVIDDFDNDFKSAWDREYYCRNYAVDKLKEICDNDTIIINSDLDEIVNREVLSTFKIIDLSTPRSLVMDLYYYNFNWIFPNKWVMATIIKYEQLISSYNGSLQKLRDHCHNLEKINNAGWHLSYFLTYEEISYKISSFSHTEYDHNKYKSIENIKSAVENGQDVFMRNEIKLLKSTFINKLPLSKNVLPDVFQRNDTFVFTNNWFKDQRSIHIDMLSNFINKPIDILEIGVHEGRSTVFFSDYLTDINSSLTCIDPFLTSDITSPVDENTFNIYTHNVNLTTNKDKITLFKDLSINVLSKFVYERRKFDYVLIDGSHLTKDVLADAILCFNLIKIGGIIFFDDYQGGDVNSLGFPAIAIDSFIKCFKDKLEILHVGYHYVVKKISC